LKNFPHEYTTLNEIPSNTTFSSQILSFEGVVVVVGDYYYDDRKKTLKKVKPKETGRVY